MKSIINLKDRTSDAPNEGLMVDVTEDLTRAVFYMPHKDAAISLDRDQVKVLLIKLEATMGVVDE